MSQQDTNGQLFIWGDDGLESLEDNVVVETPKVLPTQIANLEAFLEEETIQRERPKRTPRRQRHTFSTDEDFCNDPEEWERRREAKRQANPTRRNQPSLFARATAALARRDYSRKELDRKLSRALKEGETYDMVTEVLDRLESAGYLSDERFAETRARVRSRTLGDARIRRELRQSGVSSEHVEAAMEEIEEPEEVRAYRIWKRRFDELPKDRKERDRQIRFLMYRGFSMGAISRVISGRVEIFDE